MGKSNPKNKCECVTSQNNEKTILFGVQDVVWAPGKCKDREITCIQIYDNSENKREKFIPNIRETRDLAKDFDY